MTCHACAGSMNEPGRPFASLAATALIVSWLARPRPSEHEERRPTRRHRARSGCWTRRRPAIPAWGCVWYSVGGWRVDAVGDNDSDREIELHHESGGTDPIPATDGDRPLIFPQSWPYRLCCRRRSHLPSLSSTRTLDRDRRTAPLGAHLAQLRRSGVLPEEHLQPGPTTERFRVVERVVRPSRRALVTGCPRIVNETVLLEPDDGGDVTLLTDDEIAAYAVRVARSVPARLSTPLLILGVGLLLLACWIGSGWTDRHAVNSLARHSHSGVRPPSSLLTRRNVWPREIPIACHRHRRDVAADPVTRFLVHQSSPRTHIETIRTTLANMR
jgi:hypothetical protein